MQVGKTRAISIDGEYRATSAGATAKRRSIKNIAGQCQTIGRLREALDDHRKAIKYESDGMENAPTTPGLAFDRSRLASIERTLADAVNKDEKQRITGLCDGYWNWGRPASRAQQAFCRRRLDGGKGAIFRCGDLSRMVRNYQPKKPCFPAAISCSKPILNPRCNGSVPAYTAPAK